MNPLLHAFRDQFPNTPRALCIAVVYQDGETHQHAAAVCEFLVSELEDNAELSATWWRTSLIEDPKLAKVAARAIARADLVVFSVHAAPGPTARVQSWIASWPPQQSCPSRLIALICGEPFESAGTDWERFLEALARSREMAYLRGPVVNPDDEFESLPETAAEPYAHWGLNE